MTLKRAVFLLCFACCALVATPSLPASLSHSSHSSSTKTKKSKEKKVHVKGYTKKDGTYVAPYDRSAPGAKETTSTSRTAGRCETCPRDANGKIIRSESARHAFLVASGYPNGRPGYVVDHVIPLECGGVDDQSNMQWQTEQEARAKDKTEADCRQ